jgi:BirA family biotin operon repressor/biotin-[acetyl-CoA-carboxylase] ligase
LNLARQTGSGVYACLAEQQLAGRGRRGRHWVSPQGGNIYLSLLWRFANGVGQLGGLSLAVGVAVHRALRQLGVAEVRLKWPNDVLVQGRKLAGILLEMSGEASGPCAVVSGLGLNVRLPAAQMAGVAQDWTDLQSVLHNPVPRNSLVASLLNHLIAVMQDFERHGFAHFQAEWNAADAFAQQPVELQLTGETIQGIAQGVDESGALLLARNGQQERYHSGEVSLRAGSS